MQFLSFDITKHFTSSFEYTYPQLIERTLCVTSIFKFEHFLFGSMNFICNLRHCLLASTSSCVFTTQINIYCFYFQTFCYNCTGSGVLAVGMVSHVLQDIRLLVTSLTSDTGTYHTIHEFIYRMDGELVSFGWWRTQPEEHRRSHIKRKMAATCTISDSGKQQRTISCVSKSIAASQTHTLSLLTALFGTRWRWQAGMSGSTHIYLRHFIMHNFHQQQCNNHGKYDCVTFLAHFIRNFLEEFFTHYSLQVFRVPFGPYRFPSCAHSKNKCANIKFSPRYASTKVYQMHHKLDEEMAQWWILRRWLMFHCRRQQTPRHIELRRTTTKMAWKIETTAKRTVWMSLESRTSGFGTGP